MFVVIQFGIVFLLYHVAALFVRFWAVTNVTFTALYVGFCLPLCRVVDLYNLLLFNKAMF